MLSYENYILALTMLHNRYLFKTSCNCGESFYSTLGDREEIGFKYVIKELNRCYLCCFSEHRVSQCFYTIMTRSCLDLEWGGRHHSLLHLRTTEIEEEPTAVGKHCASVPSSYANCKTLLLLCAFVNNYSYSCLRHK